MSDIPVQNGQLPVGFCPSDLQTMLNGFSAAQFVSVSTIAGIVVSSSTPPASDHDKAWLQLDSMGRPVRLYFFAGGAWLSLHPILPGFVMIYTGVLPNFTTFDGGDATAAPYSDISGPMWQLASTSLNGVAGTQILGGALTSSFPLGVGTLPSGAAVGLLGTGGEEKHLLTDQEMAPHRHFVANPDTLAIPAALTGANSVVRATTGVYELSGDGTYPSVGQSSSDGGDPATAIGVPPVPVSALGHNNIPNYVGVYFLQRTVRQFYLVPP